MSKESSVAMSIRVPLDVKKWLEVESRKTFESQNGAIISTIRARTDAERAERAERIERAEKRA